MCPQVRIAISIIAAAVLGAQHYGLGDDRVVAETYPREANADPDWWVSSGAYFVIEGCSGSTVRGRLPENDRFRLLYARSNPADTEDGFRPQNVFRLVTTGRWSSSVQTGYFRIAAVNAAESPNRNASNGVLFFAGYQDEDNLYYAGLRVDGHAVIKRKAGGAYATLAQAKVLPGEYDRDRSPNLIPENAWIGMACIKAVRADRTVSVRLYLDLDAVGEWRLAAEAADGDLGGVEAFLGEGNAGIRTDFMDVEFRDIGIRRYGQRGADPGRGRGSSGGR